MNHEIKLDSLIPSGSPDLANHNALRERLRFDSPLPSKRLHGHLAIVTGGGTGLGRSIASHMVAAGAQVIILGRRITNLQQTAEELGERCTYVVHDLVQLEAAEELIDGIVNETGFPSILVNNAGEHLKRLALETSSSDFGRIMKTHVDGAFSLSTAIAKAMQQSGRTDCSILFISSMAAMFGIPEVAAYSAAKSAQIGLVRALATEWSASGIRVNAIAPGWIDTSMSRRAFSQDELRLQRVLQRTPMKRLGTPDEIARVATFLSSSEASFITGALLPVDGGASIGF